MYTSNSTASNSTPTANIAVNRNRLKHYAGDLVYLKDGTHFEIELYNPKTFKVLAKILVNGINVSAAGIVIRPGERVFLERWLDKSNKFLFETYEVEDSLESREAIAQNGKVIVEFYDEVQQVSQFNLIGGSATVNSLLLTDSPTWTTNPVYTGTTSTPSFGGTTVNYSTQTIGANASIAGSLETGRVESGESSTQEFSSDFTGFNYWINHKVGITLLPESQKQVEINEIRNYCTDCGTRMKAKSWKFCPSCGTKI